MSVPRAANLSSGKSNAVDVYRTRFVSPVTNGVGSVATPGSMLNIYLNTAQVSTLLDPHSCYLQLDLTLWTENRFVDYCSFGMEGIASLIREFRVFNQGNPLEEILRYGLAYRTLSFLSGTMQQEFKMFMGQRSLTGHGLTRNPPPMCDWDGLIMHGPAKGSTKLTNVFITDGMHNWPESYISNPAMALKFKEKLGNVRVQDFMNFLSNVKNIPIGMVAATTNAAKKVLKAPTLVKRTYNVCMPFMSGIVGSMAVKFLPTGLISNQAMFIQLVTSPVQQVVQLSMDPCRRIPGTNRDYVSVVGVDDTRAAIDVAGTQWRLHTSSRLANPNLGVPLTTDAIVAQITIAKPYQFSTDAASTGLLSAQVELTSTTPFCYGSAYPESHAQSARMNSVDKEAMEYPQMIGPNAVALPAATSFNYTMSNIQFVGDEIVLPPELGATIVNMVTQEGGIRIKTNSVRTYPLNVANNASQTIIVPAKIASADSIIFSFQDIDQNSVQEGLYYDSNSSINPFAKVDPSLVAVDAANNDTLGGKETITRSRQNTAFSYQLRIGNNYIPAQPIKSSTEWAVETLKVMHGLTDQSAVLDTQGYYGSELISETAEGGFFTPFIHKSLLDDQVCKHPLSRAGYVLDGVFVPPSCNSLIAFNLNGWNGMTDLASSGMYLNNNTVSLLLTGATGLAVTGRSYEGTAIIPHEAVMTILPGGQIIWTY